MKYLFTLLLCFSYSFNYCQQNTITTSQAINIIIKQAMLTQRMAKDKVYKTNNANLAKANIELSSSKILFNKNMNTLDRVDFSKQINFEIFKLDLLWQGYVQTIEENNPKKVNLKLINHANVVLDQCLIIYRSLLKLAEKNNEYPYNTSNEEYTKSVIKNYEIKYLSQQLALLYGTYYFKNKKYEPELFLDIIENIDLNVIQQSNNTSDLNKDIKTKTTKLEYNWKVFKESLKDIVTNHYISKTTSPAPIEIYNLSNVILNDADMLARAYKANSSISK